jgi:nitrogen regulatory protein PII
VQDRSRGEVRDAAPIGELQQKDRAMKLAFIVHNEFQSSSVMEMLRAAGIDYYTRWEQVKGKGRGTEPHLGAGGFPSMNSVLMIAFPEDGPLEVLVREITAANREIKRADDKIHLFQLPLERMV